MPSIETPIGDAVNQLAKTEEFQTLLKIATVLVLVFDGDTYVAGNARSEEALRPLLGTMSKLYTHFSKTPPDGATD